MKGILTLILVIIVGIASATPASAELYVAGQLGYTMPNDFTDVKLNGTGAGIASTDLKLDNGVMYGVKAGYYMPAVLNWLGVEAELYNASFHSPQQMVTLSGPGGTATSTISGSSVRTTVLAVNLIVRYPGSVLQPYAGVGPGIFFTRINAAGNSDSDTSIGLNALVGVRTMITNTLAIFAEYKYNRTSMSFNNNIAAPGAGLEGNYSSNTLAAGISIHF